MLYTTTNTNTQTRFRENPKLFIKKSSKCIDEERETMGEEGRYKKKADRK